MLKLKYLFENYGLAKEVLKNWVYDVDTIDELLTQFRISSNAIYPFEQKGQMCFLRLAPIEEKMEQNVYGELEFIQYLLKHNFPALQPVPAKNGEICLKLSTEWGEYYASAFQKVSGVQIECLTLTDEVMYQYGKTLGKLHCLSADFKPDTKKWTYVEVLEWIQGTLEEYDSPVFMMNELFAIRNELDLLPQRSDNYGLVHYDFELDNVFYDESTKICSVIDFDDGMYHWFSLDIDQVFDSLAEELDGDNLRSAQQEFLRGYKEEHCYTEEMEQSRRLMRRFVNLYAYARLIRSVADTFENEPDWLIKLREKLNKVISKTEKCVLEKNK